MESKKVNRRGFLKAAGIAGISVAASNALCESGEPNETKKCNDPNKPKEKCEAKLPLVPKRKLGRAEIEVPILALGGSNFTESQIVLQKAYDFGVRYWDTAARYAGGNSEIGIGMFIEKNPELRKDLFIVTKSERVKTIPEVEASLQKSLERMNTDYIDIFFGRHGMKDQRS